MIEEKSGQNEAKVLKRLSQAELKAQNYQGVRAIVIGRHPPDFGPESRLQVVEQTSVEFGTDTDEVASQLMMQIFHTEDKAKQGKTDAPNSIVFQASPSQLLPALGQLIVDTQLGFERHLREHGNNFPGIGFVVNEPGERPPTQSIEKSFATVDDARTAGELLAAVNPRAKVTVEEKNVTVQVEPPLRYKFKEITWLIPPAVAVEETSTDGKISD